ncbi:hypothetical protein RJD11_11900 [Bacillus velezensis]|uniref:hypothetical protein n=1 Tax=Bacillus TaxID=1386 RepID=UPI001C531611|nr:MULTISPECIES: hypothetical protein [Bacillus amyloliquefaciens group]QXP95471.1 hypothetical protein KVY05_11755 [Bacillus velezensis]QXP99274.1 hypothetical protein KVY05_21150 [Bacillus velezensis]UHH01297.1 hypothetical protein LUA14_11830 [Bacillus amyloliquefaciens]ULR21045.1 hypothetical protein MJE83_11830 [Bacillus velezensis]UVW07788.1 hypothetical protein NX856_11870 [Bacillus velezensis]
MKKAVVSVLAAVLIVSAGYVFVPKQQENKIASRGATHSVNADSGIVVASRGATA